MALKLQYLIFAKTQNAKNKPQIPTSAIPNQLVPVESPNRNPPQRVSAPGSVLHCSNSGPEKENGNGHELEPPGRMGLCSCGGHAFLQGIQKENPPCWVPRKRNHDFTKVTSRFCLTRKHVFLERKTPKQGFQLIVSEQARTACCTNVGRSGGKGCPRVRLRFHAGLKGHDC